MKVLLFIIVISFSASIFSAEKITGIWKNVSEETGLVKSISLIYEHKGKIYGRLLVSYEDSGKLVSSKEKAIELVGNPKYVGLDFIWDLVDKGNKWSKGKILDPQPGKIYSCDMWIEKGNLIVKGKIGPFSSKQTWVPFKNISELPDWVVIPNYPTPKIPKLK